MERVVPIPCPYETTHVVAYLIDAPRRTLIDAGGASHPRGAIAAALAERGLNLADIALIVNTHGHWDHAGGDAAVLADSPAADLFIHPRGAPLLADELRHLQGYLGETARLLARPDLARAQRLAIGALFEPTTAPWGPLAEGDELDLGGGVTFRVLHLPGHSEDHVGLFWEREGLLIAGDAAQGTGSRVGGCPLYFGAIAEARASIRRLRDLPFRRLLVSHPFGQLTGGRATVHDAESGRAFLDASLAALDVIADRFDRVLTDADLRQRLVEEPDLAFPDLARKVGELLTADAAWPVHPDPATTVPFGLAPTLARLVAELGEAA